MGQSFHLLDNWRTNLANMGMYLNIFFNVSLKFPQKTHAVYDQKENRVTIALARAEQLSEMTFPPNKPRKRVYDCASQPDVMVSSMG